MSATDKIIAGLEGKLERQKMAAIVTEAHIKVLREAIAATLPGVEAKVKQVK